MTAGRAREPSTRPTPRPTTRCMRLALALGAARARQHLAEPGRRRASSGDDRRGAGHRRARLRRSRAAGRMPRRVALAPGRRGARAARRSMSRSSPARITAAPAPCADALVAAGIARVVVGASRIPIRASPAAATSCCAPPAIDVDDRRAGRRGARGQSRPHHARRRRAGPMVTREAGLDRRRVRGARRTGRACMITGRRRPTRASTCCARSTTPSWSASAPSLADDPLLTVRLPGLETLAGARRARHALRTAADSASRATARRGARPGSIAGRRRAGRAERRAPRGRASTCCASRARPTGRLDLAGRAARARGTRGVTRVLLRGRADASPSARARPTWSTTLVLLTGAEAARRARPAGARPRAGALHRRDTHVGAARRSGSGRDPGIKSIEEALMFTGIVTDVGRVVAVEAPGLARACASPSPPTTRRRSRSAPRSPVGGPA